MSRYEPLPADITLPPTQSLLIDVDPVIERPTDDVAPRPAHANRSANPHHP